MTGPDPTAVRTLFERLIDADEPTRASVLAEVRKDDPALADEAAELLRHHHRTGVLLDQPAPQAVSMGPPPRTPSSALPRHIGRYAVLSELGRGGMGVVYEAQQETPHRRVALKVVRPELVTPTMLRRFAQEAEVLGRLRHPGIAQVYEAGSADDDQGAPRTFIAMELCRGRAIVDAADKRRLALRQRVRLLAEVCDAVDHAHRRGVIHRDLKPGNILVEDEVTRDTSGGGLSGLRVKILDFGIARVVDENAATAYTHAGQVVGTLAYMSPEQAGGAGAGGGPGAIDTRSDVYSLGAVLYELLCRQPPLDVRGASLPGAITIIREREPILAGRVSPELRGDLEAILAKALEKDPARRYASAAEFAADLRRYLADESVLAHAQTSWYQLRKFARRNVRLVGATAALVLALLAGVVGTGWQALRAEHERSKAVQAQDLLAIQLDASRRLQGEEQQARARAEAETDTSKRVTAYLVELLRQGHPEFGGASLTLREALERSAADVNTRFPDKPAVRLDLHAVLGSAFGALGDAARSELHYRQALDLARQLALPRRRAECAAQLASALQSLDRTREAEPFLRGELEAARAALPADDDELAGLTMRLGDVLSDLAKPEEAEPLLRSAYEVRLKVLGAEARETLVALNLLALFLSGQGRYADAEPLQQINVAGCLKSLGPDHPDSSAARTNLASALRALGREREALPLLEAAHAAQVRVLGEDHPDTIAVADQLGLTLSNLKEHDRAIEVLTRARALVPAKLGSLSVRGMGNSNNLANIYERAGRPADAEPILRELAANLESLATQPARLAMVRLTLARVLRQLDRNQDALAQVRLVPDNVAELFPPKHAFPAQARLALGSLLSITGDLDEAERVLLSAHAAIKSAQGEDHPVARATAKALAEHYTRAGKPDEAARWAPQPAPPAPGP